MTIFIRKSISKYFERNKEIKKDIIYHTRQCEVVRERFRDMKALDLTNFYFKKIEIERKYGLCKLCTSMANENEKLLFEVEEKEKQRLILEEYNLSIEQAIDDQYD